MQKQATRLIASVVMLLCVASAGLWYWQPLQAAPQRDQNIVVYIPVVHVRPPVAVGDLQVVHMGLYQSVQNPSNSVTLIAHKPALLRVYAQASADAAGNAGVVTVDAYRGQQYLGSLSVGPQAVTTQSSIDDLGSTFNFDLPKEWLEGQVTLRATIDPADAVAESNEVNNVSVSTFNFRAVPALELTIVPIQYTDTVSGLTFSQPGHDPLSDWLLSAFPISEIDVTIHEPFPFTGDLRQADGWVDLLNQLTALWSAEVGPGSSHIYFGLVPNSGPDGESWFVGGVSGLGWGGQRVSLGLDVGEATGETAGHEIGHNFNRSHAPCGNPSGVDPNFPYPNAVIGVYGVDTSDETLLDPNLTHDMMSYCGPEWVSDYTYEGLFRDQVQRSSRSGPQGEGLLIRATVDGTSLSPLPVMQLNQRFLPVEKAAKQQVQLLDERGQVIGVYPAELYLAEEEGVSARTLMAFVPLPANTRVGQVRFLQDGVVIAERSAAADLAATK